MVARSALDAEMRVRFLPRDLGKWFSWVKCSWPHTGFGNRKSQFESDHPDRKFRGSSSVERASGCEPGGRWFKSSLSHSR